MNTDLAKNMPFEEVAKRGAELYERIKTEFEPGHRGEFLAIEPDSEQRYLGNDTAEALELARAAHPNKLFYVVKIGFSSAETLSHSILRCA